MINKCMAFALNESSPAAKVVRQANADHAQCGIVLPPHLINQKPKWQAGYWNADGIYILQPASYLPTGVNWPFNKNSVWNGSEITSRPRVGSVLRESGFDRVDVVIVEHFCLIPAIRFLQPKILVTLITQQNFPTKNDSEIIQKRWREVAEDSDAVFVERGLEGKLNLRSEPPLFRVINPAEKNWERDCLQTLGERLLVHEN